MLEQISVKIIADSIGPEGQRITTWELEYPRFIHAELMTHRMFSRNAASSRAIPIQKMMELVDKETAMPVQWGLNQAGMQAGEQHNSPSICERVWNMAAQSAIDSAENLDNIGLHKQIVNRVLEPFQRMKTIVTATEYDNWYHLRNHTDAQPEIHVLAAEMWKELNLSEPEPLGDGEWHVPYVETWRASDGDAPLEYFADGVSIPLEDALKISASCCAQVSYRRLDEGLDKAIMIYNMLIESQPVHASPIEHQASPMRWPSSYPPAVDWEEGVTHMDKEGNFWSGNLKGWIQHRQLIKDNTCWNYKDHS